MLIRHFQPVWCSIISGFGIHAPGKGRGGQMRSMWDEIHPGRCRKFTAQSSYTREFAAPGYTTLSKFSCAVGVSSGGIVTTVFITR